MKERIAGIKLDLGSMGTNELESLAVAQLARLERAQADYERVMSSLALRGMINDVSYEQLELGD